MKYRLGLFALSWVVGWNAWGQGSLTPAGSPAESMKTLQQVEPRIDVATLPGNFATEHVITSPGSYYLSGNVHPNNDNGVRIEASNVTLDLNGFEIAPSAGNPTSGLTVDSGLRNVTVRNGTIRGFGYGVVNNSNVRSVLLENLLIADTTIGGIVADDSWTIRNCRIEGGSGNQGGLNAGSSAIVEYCAVMNWQGSSSFAVGFNSVVQSCVVQGGEDGISAGAGSIVRDCSVNNVTGDWGILVETGSIVSDCSVTASAVQHGIEANESVVLHNCVVSENTSCDRGISTERAATIRGCNVTGNIGDGVESYGIYATSVANVSDCVSRGNSNTNTPGVATHGVGLRVQSGSQVRNCSVAFNRGNGIRASQDCHILNNVCDSNGSGGDGAGIFINSSDTRVEGNNVMDNDRGIHVDNSGGSMVIRNSASGNSTNYVIDAGNRVGTIVNAPGSLAISGSTGGAGMGTTDPWANFSF